MTNNLDDFDQQEDLEQGLASTKSRAENLKANIREAWRTQPLFKLMVLMVVVGAAVAASVSFFSSGPPDSPAVILHPPDTHEAPGREASSYVREQTDAANKQRAKEALESGGSALPTPRGHNATADILDTLDQNTPLNQLRAEVERLKAAKQPQQVQQQVQPPEQFDNTLAQAMQAQLKQIMESWAPPHNIKQVVVLKEEKATDQTGIPSIQPTTTSASTSRKALLSAGTISYAQLLVEANSDIPGPILAQIVSGPLSGARAVGEFQVANGNADYLVLKFSLATLKGKDYRIDAIALDPDTTLGGMATEVDQRYFIRMILPAAAGFLQGFASALGEPDTSTSQNQNSTIIQQSGKSVEQGLFTGLGQAAQMAGQFFSRQASQTRPLVRVATGTPMGLFFISSVYEDGGASMEKQAETLPAKTQGAMQNPAPYPSQAGYGGPQQGAMYNQDGYMMIPPGYGSSRKLQVYTNSPSPNAGYPTTSYMGAGGGYP